jgi:ADP-heptose:LPS heptosyltransferase
MKRWPLDHWRELIRLLPECGFVLLGGPEDSFLGALAEVAPDRTLNLAGQLSLAESSALLRHVDLVIANDTGLMHVADQMEVPTLALIGPTAFGYPSHTSSRTLEVDLPCKPCSKDGRGKCVNSLYQRCMIEITPESVATAAKELIAKRGFGS